MVYANSVLGARCNRNSAYMDIFGAILGRVPYFGLLTDEGRRASWVVEVKTSKRPEAQVLGSAIGLKVMEDVPYIKGAGPLPGRPAGRQRKGVSQGHGRGLPRPMERWGCTMWRA